MIFYYSATGNSYWAARELAEKQGDVLISVTEEMKAGRPLKYGLREDETLGFVFPVHAWNPPDTFMEFLDRMELTGYCGQYAYGLATCGDSSGYTMKVLGKALRAKGIPMTSEWEVAMPNNYLPLQDVDSPKREAEKLRAAETSVAELAEAIEQRKAVVKRLTGSMPVFKTSVIGFFFRKMGKSKSPFYTTSACTSCGMCERICLKGTISMRDGKPAWTGTCDQCYACINRCPVKAIQYGKKTESRGRYCHPLIRQ